MSDVEDDDPGNCSGDEAAEVLSAPAEAARQVLRDEHRVHRKRCWNVSHGKCVGEIHQTPPREFWGDRSGLEEAGESHSDCFPEKLLEVITKATEWVDLTSLAPPDGKFLEKLHEAVVQLHESGNEVTIRILFGNIPGMPADCEGIVESLTEGIPNDTQIKLWVGAWRKGLSWNHSKIVAVDGKYLFQGGHNLWADHYLKSDPVHDLSMEAEGQVAVDGHVFANRMWQWTSDADSQYWIQMMLPDWIPFPAKSRAGVSRFPKRERDYPPSYSPLSQPLPLAEAAEQGDYPMITIGRYGILHDNPDTANPSDSAITAMLTAAQTCIRMSLQDLGPLTLPTPGELRAIPSGVWPLENLTALGLAMADRDVSVQIVLSSPFACPGHLNPMTANYGNGWSKEDVASEIMKALRTARPDIEEDRIAAVLTEKLQITVLCVAEFENKWNDDQTIGNHAKFFIVDDVCYYVGSQNLYIANLAEWGVVVDNAEQTQAVLEQYWNPMWENSWKDPDDEEALRARIDGIIQGIEVDRAGGAEEDLSEEERVQLAEARKRCFQGGSGNSLSVWMKRATNLKDSDGGPGSGSDAYVKLRLEDGDGNKIMFKQCTRVLSDGGPNPEWNEYFDFEGLDTPGAYTLKMTVMDQDSLFGMEGDLADNLALDDKLGVGRVDLGTLKNVEGWQEKEVMIADGWFSDSMLFFALDTKGQWGN